jgi:hypothetical protein
MLGLIDRRKQLKLMQHSKAVIQPSLFEGWSTVIEDAKALSKTVIASDIPVHKEQLNDHGFYFEPHNHTILINRIKDVIRGETNRPHIDYKNGVKIFGESFMSILNELNTKK